MALDGIRRRVCRLEARRPQETEPFTDWVRALSDEELDARIHEVQVAMTAILDAGLDVEARAELEVEGWDIEEFKRMAKSWPRE